jgi:hypothetical protein
MMLNFDDELGARHFDFCFTGFVLGGSMQQTSKGMTVLRTEVALFEKLESLSELKPCGKKLANGEPDRRLKADGNHSLHLDPTEYDLLFNYLAAVPWQSGTPTKYAVETLDWLARTQREGRT